MGCVTMFNIEKLSIEQFNEIKGKMIKLVENFNAVADSNENNSDFNMELFYKEFVNQYILYQQKLLSYDLSDIPFEAWDSISIITPEIGEEFGIKIDNSIVDFSGTRANLDFDIINISGKGNFKNCNVKNIQRHYHISEDSFDEQTIQNNSNVFLSDTFSEDFKQKFYNNKLKIEDIIGLSDEQLKEIKENVNYEWCDINSDSRFLGLERCIELYKYSPQDYYEVMENLSHRLSLSSNDSQYYEQLFTCDLKDLKEISFNYFRETLIKSSYSIMGRGKNYPQRLIDANADIFLQNIDLDSNIRNRYYNRCLTIDDIHDNIHLFQNIDVSYFISDYDLKKLAKIIEIDKFYYLIRYHSEELKILNNVIDFSVFHSYWNESLDNESAFLNVVKLGVLDCIQDSSQLSLLIDKFGFEIVDSCNSIEKLATFSDKTFLLDKKQAKVLYTFGFDHILEFEKNVHYLSDSFNKNINLLSERLMKKGFPYNDTIYSFMLEIGNFDELLVLDGDLREYGLDDKGIKILNTYKELEFSVRSIFKEYIVNNFEEISIDRIDLIAEIFIKLSYSNSTEIFSFRDNLARQLLVTDNPIENIERIEKIFIKNNIPLCGKIFSCFQILYPDLEKYDFSNSSRISPQLKNQSLPKVGFHNSPIETRFNIIFNDLLRIAYRSNNRDFMAYLNNIELGNNIYLKMLSNGFDMSGLSNEEQQILEIFANHLETLYYNTEKVKESCGDLSELTLKEKIPKLAELFQSNSKYDLKDRIVRSFCYYAGIDSFDQLKQLVIDSVKEADERGRRYAKDLSDGKIFHFEEGDFVRGIGSYKTLGSTLNTGNVSKEYLSIFTGESYSDTTPLDTDITLITKTSDIYHAIEGTPTGFNFGNVYVIFKKDNPNLNITRDKNGNLTEMKYDPAKLEVFGTMGYETHWGIRTGFAFTDVDYILYKKNQIIDSVIPYDKNGNVNYQTALTSDEKHDDLPAIKFEIARNGYYIPVIDFSGKLIFTEKEYEDLRQKMSGLSYYREPAYNISDNIVLPDIENILWELDASEVDTKVKRDKINNIINNVLNEFNLTMKEEMDGDLTPGSIELIDTGSTGRNTNVPYMGDFDLFLRVDQSLISDKKKYDHFKTRLLEELKKYPMAESPTITDKGDYRLKGVKIDDVNVVDIDISFGVKTNKISYSSDECLKDRLRTIRNQDPEKYKYVVANIIIAKQVLKQGEVYKPKRVNQFSGGLGGIGIENWILQNGGSLIDAANDFLKNANGKDFNDFKSNYSIWDFGENHFAIREDKGNYLHDNFVTDNMSNAGYVKMQQVLKDYLKKVEFTKLSDNADAVIEAMANGIIDINGQPILENQSDSYDRKMGFTAIQWLGLVSSLFPIVIALLGILFLLFTR